jgi:teichuronic acid biosynthesis glycosyltransferase TuaG
MISIITPFRNAEKYILETAESIFAQTYRDWEWILVNDHSTENELELLAPFLKDSRIKLDRKQRSGNHRCP